MMKLKTGIGSKLATAVFAVALFGTPTLAIADTASTAAIVTGAAGIIGALIYDSNNHPYYVNQGHRYYVSDQQANSYRGNHRGTIRHASARENQMPVARPYPDRNNSSGSNRGGSNRPGQH